MTVYADLIGLPFFEGGRFPGPVDCLGISLEATRRDGVPFPDVWLEIEAAWKRGVRDFSSWTPAGWRLLPTGTRPRAGDVAVMLDGADSPSHLIYMATDRDALHAVPGTTSRLVRLRPGRVVATFRRDS